MTGLVAVIAGLVLLLLLAGCKPSGKESSSGPTPVPGGTPTPGGAAAGIAGREQIAARLAELASRDAPTDLRMGAMCYDMAAPPATVDFVCPVCGGKTNYPRDATGERRDQERQWGRIMFVELELPACRRIVQAIDKPWIRLDESEFCRTCRPAVENPQLVLEVEVPGTEAPHRTRGVGSLDLAVLRDFLAGSDRVRGSNDGETPLKDHLDRLEDLLGVKR